jgi:hypothetical protein
MGYPSFPRMLDDNVKRTQQKETTENLEDID